MSSSDDEDEQKQLRQLIRQAHTDATLTPSQRARRIRLLISSGGDLAKLQELEAASPSAAASSSSAAATVDDSGAVCLDDGDRQRSYYKEPAGGPFPPAALAQFTWEEDGGVLGCRHYPRAHKILAACCRKFFVCRFCHDDVADHKIDRYKVEELVCMRCWTRQPFASKCTNPECGGSFGRWYCGFCKFIDDTPNKKIFHCEGCGMCRVAEKRIEDYRHCDVCVACVPVGEHVCIPNSMKSNCPICSEDLFSSRRTSAALRCGHRMHSDCQDQYFRAGNDRCPLCLKTAIDPAFARAGWEQLRRAIDERPMQPEFAQTQVEIHCNDCNTKSRVPFHFYGLQCPQPDCTSFNTTRLNIFNWPGQPAINQLIAQQLQAEQNADAISDDSGEQTSDSDEQTSDSDEETSDSDGENQQVVDEQNQSE